MQLYGKKLYSVVSPYENQFIAMLLQIIFPFILIGSFVDSKMQMNGQGISKQLSLEGN